MGLADGVFTGDGNRDLYFVGKEIIVSSRSGNPEECIIDVEGTPSDNHRGFLFYYEEGPGSVISGLTITGGYLEAAQGPNGWQSCNMRTQFERIVKRAGMKPWPKLFQNLRSTRQTELAEDFPAHVVCAWIGNSERVANQHYLQLTDEHFAKASRDGSQSVAHPVAHSTPVQPLLAPSRKEQSPEKQAFDGAERDGVNPSMGDTGLEPVTSTV